MITDYASLQSAITDTLKRTDLATVAPQFIQFSEAEFNRRLRVKEMEVDTTFDISPGDASPGWAPFPNSYLDMREMRINLGAGKPWPLLFQTPSMLARLNPTGSIGLPRYFTVENNKFRFDKIPDATYTIEIVYIQAILGLNDGNPTNWLIQKHPDLYLYQSLLHSAPYLKNDPRLMTWASILEGDNTKRPGLYDQIMQADRRAKFTSAPLTRRPAISPRDGFRTR